jgi:hypothetical protein
MVDFMKEKDIRGGSLWRACDGSSIRVRVQAVSNGIVQYVDLYDGIARTKDVFSFQVRYTPAEEP